jgi:hypothetical protein
MIFAQPNTELKLKAKPRLPARPTGEKVDLRAFHEETMARCSNIMKRLAE